MSILIYNHNRVAPRLGLVARGIALLVAVVSAGLLVTAARLTPDAAGVGTHKQLGLPPCTLLANTGIPCMTCGMTTSFALLTDGDILASLRTQPAGTVLAILTALTAVAAVYIAATGLPARPWLSRFPTTRQVVVLATIVVLGWAYKIWQTAATRELL